MSVEGLNYPVELESLGGLWTTPVDQTSVPAGRSPSCQNVRFFPGGRVATREGLTTQATIAAQKILGIKDYVDNAMTRYGIILVDDGTLRYEQANFTYTTIATNVVTAGIAPLLRLSSTSLFNKEWICFGACSIFGSNPPKVFYNDTGSGNKFFDPVATEAPALAPTVAASATAGSVSLGTHLVRVFFKTRTGYWTSLSPATSITVAVANKALDISNIALGPAYITERVIVATPATSNNYFFLDSSAMVIKDNTTTAVTIDFTDANLTNGTPVTHPTLPASDLFRQTVVNAAGAVNHYSGRLAYWGFRHHYNKNGDIGFWNMKFQGGWNAAGVPKTQGSGTGTTPNGWTLKTAGWTNANGGGGLSIYGDPARITGTGASAAVYENAGIWQQIIPAGVEVWARVRAKKGSTWAATESFHLYPADTASAAGTITATAHADFTGTDFANTTEFQVISKRMMTAAANTGWTTGTRLRFATGNGTVGVAPIAGHLFDIDYIEIYTPGFDGDNSTSLIRWSKVNNPEAIDGLYGIMQVEPENGEPLTASFEMKGAFFMCKERSMFVTQDNGSTEPKDWSIDKVSTAIGTPSRFGVGMADGWAAIASRSGLYFFDGSTPRVRLSDEIVPTWNRINFANGLPGPAQKIWCIVDNEAKRIYVGVPLDGATEVSHILVCDYSKAGSMYTAAPAAIESRDWTIWTLGPLCAGFSLRPDGSRAVLFGDSSGRVAKIDATATSDFGGTAINSIYRTNFMSPSKGRNLLGKIVLDIQGSGTLGLKTFGTDSTTSKTWSTAANTLAANPNKFAEWKTQHINESIAIEVSTNANGAGFQLAFARAWFGGAPSGIVREHQA
jgi:hypothetical protein